MSTIDDQQPFSRNLLDPRPTAIPPAGRKAFINAAHLFTAFLDTTTRLMFYATITLEALEHFKDHGLADLEPPESETSDEYLERLIAILQRKDTIKFLDSEADHAEAHVYGNAAIALWGALEAYIDDVNIAVLSDDSTPLANLDNKVKLTAAEVFGLDPDRRLRRVVELVMKEEGAALAPGAGAFERRLKPFGLGGGVADATRDELNELAASRHCLVHRRGIADDKFIKDCPNARLQVGEPIRLTAKRWARFLYAALHYAGLVLDRVHLKYDPTSRPRDFARRFFKILCEHRSEPFPEG